MKRRSLLLATIAGRAAARSSQARAQQPIKPKLVALLGVTSPQTGGPIVEGLKQALHDLGWTEGGNIAYEIRWADGRADRLPGLARELVALKPDVITTLFTSSALALRQATSTIPIVVHIADPVAIGLAQSLARPGGNVTGVSNVNADIGPKLIELLRGVVPNAARIGVLWNPDNPSNAVVLKHLRAGAELVHVSLVPIEVRNLADIERALLRMSLDAVEGVIVGADGVFFTHGRRIGELLIQYRLPSAVQGRFLLSLGALLSYAVSLEESNRRGAYYIDRILRGAHPADLPIEQPTRFELVINARTAKALGLTIPQALLLRADEVIE